MQRAQQLDYLPSPLPRLPHLQINVANGTAYIHIIDNVLQFSRFVTSRNPDGEGAVCGGSPSAFGGNPWPPAPACACPQALAALRTAATPLQRCLAPPFPRAHSLLSSKPRAHTAASTSTPAAQSSLAPTAP